MLKIIIIGVFFLHFLAIAEPWPDDVLNEFQALGELVLRTNPPKKINTFKITDKLRSYLFISKGNGRLILNKRFKESFSCRLNPEGEAIDLTRNVCLAFKNFFEHCKIDDSIQQPNTYSSEDIGAGASERLDQPENDMFLSHSLAIAEPWPDHVLNEFQALGELVLRTNPPKKINTFKISDELRSYLFISKGKGRLMLNKRFKESFSCRLNPEGEAINLTRNVCLAFKNFFEHCKIDDSIQQPNTYSSEDIIAGASERLDQPENDSNIYIQSALSVPLSEQTIVSVGTETTAHGPKTIYCTWHQIDFINPQTQLPVIDLMWNEDIDREFQKLGHTVLKARTKKQSIEVSSELLKVLFKKTGVSEFELRSFSQAPVNVRGSFDGKNMNFSVQELIGLKRFFENCLIYTWFEKPTIPGY
jgi:hypothetical protein